jgi:hypothetical protein
MSILSVRGYEIPIYRINYLEKVGSDSLFVHLIYGEVISVHMNDRADRDTVIQMYHHLSEKFTNQMSFHLDMP